MKKTLILSFLFAVLYSGFASAQCVPYDTNRPGIYPDTLVNLPAVLIDQPYEAYMTAVIPKDTLVFGNRINFDSVGILSFDGLPSGFTYTANTKSGYWPGDTSGCIAITGTASSADIGVYPLKIKVRSFVGGLISDNDVPGYKLVVKDPNNSISPMYQQNVACYFEDQKLVVRFSDDTFEPLIIEIFGIDGRLKFKKSVDAFFQQTAIDVSGQLNAQQIYFITIKTSTKLYNFKRYFIDL